MVASIFAYALTTAIMAAIPTLIAFPAVRWMPNKQRRKDARTYRLTTAAAAYVLCAAEMLTIKLAPSFSMVFFLLATASASYLTIHWFRYSRTPKGRYLLQSAKAEQARNEAQAGRMYELPKNGF